MNSARMLDLFKDIQKTYLFPYELKHEQTTALVHLMNGSNVVVVAATGFGKTDVFTLFPLLMDLYRPNPNGNHIAVVVSPLTSLVNDQCVNIKKKNVKVIALKNSKEMDSKDLSDVCEGNFSVVLMTPEALLDAEYWRENILGNRMYEERTCLLALDEAHIISTWGKTFRKAYSALDEIRSSFVNAQLLFLTATITLNGLRDCLKCLQTELSQVRIVAKQSDRPNVYLGYKSEKDLNVIKEIDWYLRRLRMDGKWAPKCILYVRSLSLAGMIYAEIMYALKNDAYCGPVVTENRMVAEYHGESESTDQEWVLKSFSMPDGNIRLVIATVAFGMGINIPDISFIMHWGPPNSILEYWQEIGRAGRDGSKCFAQFYGVKSLTSGAAEDVRTMIKDVNSQKVSCLRVHVLSVLQLPQMDSKYLQKLKDRTGCQSSEVCVNSTDCLCGLCNCCSLCRQRCECLHKKILPEKL